MFSLDVVDTDRFLEMPSSTQNLYFHLGMRADDEGFVASPKKVTSVCGSGSDDMKLLAAKGYIQPFESGVIVIRHWNQNNYLQKDRWKPSRCIVERKTLALEDGIYYSDTDCIQTVSSLETQSRVDKSSIDKSSINTICSEPEEPAPNRSGILIPLNDKTFYDVPVNKITLWEDTYPAVDIEQDLKRMISWLESNPTKKKTKRGVDRFINNWLSRTQDNGGSKKAKTNQNRLEEWGND